MSRMSRWASVVVLSAAAMMLGCEPPNHVDAPEDGSTMYFSFGPIARWSIGQGSQLYAFDVETCRLRCLNDHPGMNTWTTGTADGSKFSFTRILSQSDFQVYVQNAGDREPRKLGNIINSYGMTFYVPGDGWLLGVEGRALATMRWVLFDPTGREVAPGMDAELKAVGSDTPARAKNRVAVAAWGLIKEYWKTNQKPYGISVYVVDLAGNRTCATLAGTLDAHYHEIPMNFIDNPSVDLAFSPDGKRIVASVWSITKTTFYEFDAAGQSKPKELFSDAKALRPEYASDGCGIVYMRAHPDPVKYNVMQIMLRRPGDAQPKAVAELPGLPRGCGTALRRLSDGRMRALHLADDGIHIVQFAADGSNVTTCWIPADKLEKQRQLARFEYVFKQNPAINQWQAPWDVVKNVPVPTAPGVKREDDVAVALEKAFAENTSWKPAAVAVASVPVTVVEAPKPKPQLAPEPPKPETVVEPPKPPPTPQPVPTPEPQPAPQPAPVVEAPKPAPIVESPKPAPEPAPVGETPAPEPAKPLAEKPAAAERGRMVKCPHCGQAFFLADDK